MIWIIDIEASSLSIPESYPIEIALGGIDPRARELVETYSWLVCPLENWTDWNDDSEKIHGISREEIELGVPAVDVASEISFVTANQMLWSDAWFHDTHWLSKLMKDTNTVAAHERIGSIGELIHSTCQRVKLTDLEAYRWMEEKTAELTSKEGRPHRALPDVRHISDHFLRICAEADSMT